MKRVLVTGATGFIGRPSLARLLAMGYEVHATTPNPIEEGVPEGVHWHRANLLDTTQTGALMETIRSTHLLHLAWYAVPGRYQRSTENLRWVRASLFLVEQFLRWGGRRVTVAGTCAEYDWRHGRCKENATPLEAAELYSVCKHALHSMLTSWSKQMKFSLSWGRVFFLYGPFEHPKRLVSSVICSLLKNETAPCTEGLQERDFLHVHDVANALVALLDSDVEGPVNIGSGKAVAIRDIILTLGCRLGREDLLRLGALPSPAGEQPIVVADVDRLHNEVDWRPKFGLEEGLEDTVEWWKHQSDKST
jgi:nucleoside-diphosphate-sugar epimerase